MKRSVLLGVSVCFFAAMPVLAAAAVPLPNMQAVAAQSGSDPVHVKGGHGGPGHGFGRHSSHRSHGWNRGKKVGWRGRRCPPGLWKQGRC